ncbi:heterodisulfide reductase, subunit B [Candidatus Acetothermia bacterium]|nr:MAG: heterodisulfide reductase, subunit B [Candidatus Acetothermia bacterium]
MKGRRNSSPITHHPSRIPYFPGCALKDQARGFERAAQAAMERLGYELAELPRWNCCGTVYSLSSDDLMRHVAPVRNFIRVQEMGERKLVTLCAMCYNTLRRSADFVSADPERLRRINAFMDEEDDYAGGVEVLHLLQILRDAITFEEIEAKVERPLYGLKVAPYYGCMLLRPREVGIDDPDAPEVMELLVEYLGAEAVDSPHKVECCGAYQTVANPGIARERVQEIVWAAARRGADVIITSCPLCTYNLEHHQLGEEKPHHPSLITHHPIPVLYFTQLLAYALGVPEGELGFEDAVIDPRPALSQRVGG